MQTYEGWTAFFRWLKTSIADILFTWMQVPMTNFHHDFVHKFRHGKGNGVQHQQTMTLTDRSIFAVIAVIDYQKDLILRPLAIFY